MDFAAMMKALMDERGLGVRALAGRVPCDKALISRLANGRERPSRQMARRLDEALGAGGRLASAAAAMAPPGARGGMEDDEDPVRRREFAGLAGASLFSAVLAGPAAGGLAGAVESFAAALAAGTPAPAGEPDLAALAGQVAAAKRGYQACRYADVIREMPGLLARLGGAAAALGGDERLRAYALSAEAHHVAASVLLKLGEHGLAPLAADRSMQAARASEDPLAAGCGARIVTHALMAGGHLGAAVTTARSVAARLDTTARPADGESLSVYGALLLRGAIAAAQDGNRGTAGELLGEAGEAGRRLGTDANLRWTAFGPANVAVHKVSIAVMLGDAGTAVDTARTIDLDQLAVTERKAALLVETARAFLMWGKHEKAYTVLRAAEQLAPAEVAAPAPRQVARDLAATAPPSLRRHARDFAARVQASQ
ncbi:MAG TPA: helix-turn-helix transcriptional regulator [Streptosporangiaceae bacterium]